MSSGYIVTRSLSDRLIKIDCYAAQAGVKFHKLHQLPEATFSLSITNFNVCRWNGIGFSYVT